MVALPDGAQVVGAAPFPERLQDGGDGRGALGGQVAPDPPRPVHRGVEEEVAVGEAAAGRVVVGVGLLRPPRLVGGLREELQVVQARPRRGRLDEDLVGLALELVVVDPPGPGGDLPRPGDGERPGRGGGVEVGVAGQQAHLADGGPGVPAAEAVPGGEPRGAGGVAVGVVVVAGVEPAQEPVPGGPEQRGDRPELLQGLGAGGGLEVGGGRGVEVVGGRAGGPQRVGDALEPPAGPQRVGHAREPPAGLDRAGRAGEAAAGGGQGASRTVWRAHHQPPPLRWTRVAAGVPGRPPRMRLASYSRGMPASPYRIPVRSAFIKSNSMIILFDYLSATPSTGNRGWIESAGTVR